MKKKSLINKKKLKEIMNELSIIKTEVNKAKEQGMNPEIIMTDELHSLNKLNKKQHSTIEINNAYVKGFRDAIKTKNKEIKKHLSETEIKIAVISIISYIAGILSIEFITLLLK